MVGQLPDLPEELISNITCRLGDDKFALRATCRALQEKSFHEFATEHFSAKCVHFTTDSLKVLLDISRCPRLSKYVKEVSIITALFSDQSFGCPGRAAAHWKPSVRQSEAYKFYVNDQKTLRTTGNDEVMLTEIFKCLPSVKVVSLIDNPSCLKPDVDYRGGNKVLRQTGTLPINGAGTSLRVRSPEFRKHLEHLWSTLLSALAGAHGTLSLDSFRTNFSSDQTFINPYKQLALDASVLSGLSKVFQNTASLRLHLKSPERKGYKDQLAKFTRTFSNLRELTLDFDTNQASGPVYQKFALGVDMSRLTKLNILGLSVDAARLTSSVTRLRAVVDLRFYCVDLASGSWPTVLKAITDLEHLKHLHLMYLREAGHKSYFLKQRETAPDAPGGFPFGDHFDDPWTNEDGFSDVDTEEEDSEGEDSDDDMLGLQSDDPSHPLWQPESLSTVYVTTNARNHDETGDVDDDMSDYVPPDFPAGYANERGFFICIEGHGKITKRLPTFIDEYNIGEFMDENDDGLMPPGLLPPMAAFPVGLVNGANIPPPQPIVNAFMNIFGGPMGTPPLGTAANSNNNPAGANGIPATGGGPAANTPTIPTPFPGVNLAAAAAAGAGLTSNWDDEDQEEWVDDGDERIPVDDMD